MDNWSDYLWMRSIYPLYRYYFVQHRLLYELTTFSIYSFFQYAIRNVIHLHQRQIGRVTTCILHTPIASTAILTSFFFSTGHEVEDY